MELGLLIGWLGGSVLVAMWAAKRGRSGFGWLFFGLLLSPLLAWLFVALLPKIETAPPAGTEVVAETTHRRCSQCAEFIRREAVRCKHCGAEVSPQPYVDPRQRQEKPHSSEGARRFGRAFGRLFSSKRRT